MSSTQSNKPPLLEHTVVTTHNGAAGEARPLLEETTTHLQMNDITVENEDFEESQDRSAVEKKTKKEDMVF